MEKNAWKKYDTTQLEQLEQLANQYKQFLNTGKTERECVREAIRQAKEAGYVDLQDIITGKKPMQSKIYAVSWARNLWNRAYGLWLHILTRQDWI